MSLPAFQLLPSALAQSAEFQANASLAFTQENKKGMEQLFSVASTDTVPHFDAAAVVNVISDPSLSDSKKSSWLLEQTNSVLKSITDTVNTESPINQFEPLLLSVQNAYSDSMGLAVYCEDVGRVDLKPNIIPERLRPVVIPLLDKLCWFGHVIPEWSILDYCGWGGEIQEDLKHWQGLLPNILVDIEKGLLSENDIPEIINENDLYSLFSLEEIDINLDEMEG